MQIDGGSENVAKAMIATCELMIARRLVNKINLTRLPTGHNRCDGDAVFGRIWTKIRTMHLLSPQQYEEQLLRSIQQTGMHSQVYDIFVVPDYMLYLGDYIDKNFGCYAKEENTKHQFIFEAVDVSDEFPCGCRTTYRATNI
jgi:hypothetical protein